MKLIHSSEGAKRASISKHVQIGKPKIKIGGNKYVLPDDIEKSKVTQESTIVPASSPTQIAHRRTLGHTLAIDKWS